MRAPVAFLALLVCGCASAPAASPGPPAAAELAIVRVPDRVGEMQRTETRRLPPGAGTLYRYRNGSALEPDVYVYPLTETARARGGTPLQHARAESEVFPVALEVERRRGRFDRFEVRADSAVTVPVDGGRVQGWHTYVQLSRRGQPRDTHQYLFALGDQLVKVRVSFAPGAVAEAGRRRFVEELVRALLSPPARWPAPGAGAGGYL